MHLITLKSLTLNWTITVQLNQLTIFLKMWTLEHQISLMAKARAGFHGPYGTGISQLVNGMGGAEYIASLLTGYTGKRKKKQVLLYENKAFPGGWISMAPQLYGEDVDFDDGHANDLTSEAQDIAAFLMWTAEPKMMDRKYTGFVGFFLLGLLAVASLYDKQEALGSCEGSQGSLVYFGRITTRHWISLFNHCH